MRLTRLFKSRVCAVAAAVALFLCLAAANAGAQDDAIFRDIQNAIFADDGATVVRLIRQNGIDINGKYYVHGPGGPGKDSGYATALASAVGYGRYNVIRALLDAGADVNAQDKGGWTALFAPSIQSDNRKAAVRVLIARGSDLNAQDEDGDTALMKYARWGNVADLVKILLDAGADVNIRNNEGETALMIAEREGEILTARLLRRARGYR